MYKEYAKPVFKTTLLIIGLIGLAIVLAGVVNTLITYFNLPYRSLYQLLILASLSAVVYFLIKNILSEYAYSLIDNELIISAKLGQNEQIKAQIPVSSIEIVASCTCPTLQNRNFAEKYSAKKSLVSNTAYTCIFYKNDKVCALEFEPSEKMLNLLKEKGVHIEK